MEQKRPELPRCKSKECRASILIPMRYVAACSRGNLMEVDWWRWAHSKVQEGKEIGCSRKNPHLLFLSSGSSSTSLKSLRIECKDCGASRELGDILRTYFYDDQSIGGEGEGRGGGGGRVGGGVKCSGRQPWQARDKAEDCKAKVVVLLRSETSVHYADIVSALDLDEEGRGHTVHELDGWLFKNHSKILKMDVKLENLKGLLPNFVEQASSGLGREVTVTEIESVFRKLLEPQAIKAVTEGDSMRAELDKLSRPSPETNAKAPLRVRSSGWESKGN